MACRTCADLNRMFTSGFQGKLGIKGNHPINLAQGNTCLLQLFLLRHFVVNIHKHPAFAVR